MPTLFDRLFVLFLLSVWCIFLISKASRTRTHLIRQYPDLDLRSRSQMRAASKINTFSEHYLSTYYLRNVFPFLSHQFSICLYCIYLFIRVLLKFLCILNISFYKNIQIPEFLDMSAYSVPLKKIPEVMLIMFSKWPEKPTHEGNFNLSVLRCMHTFVFNAL